MTSVISFGPLSIQMAYNKDDRALNVTIIVNDFTFWEIVEYL